MARVLSSNPARVTMKARLMREVTGNHLMKSTFLEQLQSPVSGSADLDPEISGDLPLFLQQRATLQTSPYNV